MGLGSATAAAISRIGLRRLRLRLQGHPQLQAQGSLAPPRVIRCPASLACRKPHTQAVIHVASVGGALGIHGSLLECSPPRTLHVSERCGLIGANRSFDLCLEFVIMGVAGGANLLIRRCQVYLRSAWARSKAVQVQKRVLARHSHSVNASRTRASCRAHRERTVPTSSSGPAKSSGLAELFVVPF